jgi:hypothetical protein
MRNYDNSLHSLVSLAGNLSKIDKDSPPPSHPNLGLDLPLERAIFELRVRDVREQT